MKKGQKRIWIHYLSVPAVVAAAGLPGHAAVYFSVEEAQQAIFPGQTFSPLSVELTPEQAEAVKKKSGMKVPARKPKIWRASGGGIFVIDEVLGKHEFIVYAVGIGAAGRVVQIEVMDYRETYGYEIRSESWRAQFAGKSAADALELNQDIKNISGATLSCKHVTDGVRRLLAMYEILFP